jgi:hypothetical protein
MRERLRPPFECTEGERRGRGGGGWWGHDLRGKIEPLLDRFDGGTAFTMEADYVRAVEAAFPVG